MIKYLVAALLVAAPVSAQSINGVSGEFSHGESVTITGTDFGTKGVAAPMRWSSFQEGTPGDGDDGRIALLWEHGGFETQRGYVGGDSTMVTYQNTRERYSGDVSIMQDYSNHTYPYAISGYGVGVAEGTDVDTLYVAGWMYIDSMDGAFWDCRNYKSLGQFSTQPYPNGDVVRQSRVDCYPLNGPTSGVNLYVEARNPSDGASVDVSEHDYFSMSSFPIDRWGRLERGMMQGRPSQTGTSFVNIDCEQMGVVSGVSFFESGAAEDAETYNWFYLSRYFARDTSPVPEMRIYWSSLYADTTMARVEVGDNADYELCSVRETLIPSAWSESSITAEVYNPTAFASGSTAYVFVVDRSNSPSTGYPVTIGGTSGNPLAPGRPANMVAWENDEAPEPAAPPSPPDTTAPIISCSAVCNSAWQRLNASADEPSVWAYRAYVGKATAWSAWTSTYTTSLEEYFSLAASAGKTAIFEVKAMDEAGNESLVCSDSFTWIINGACP